MATQNVGDRFSFRELHQAARAFEVPGEVGDVQAARVQMIAREQDARLAIVVGEVGGLMSWNGEDVDVSVSPVSIACARQRLASIRKVQRRLMHMFGCTLPLPYGRGSLIVFMGRWWRFGCTLPLPGGRGSASCLESFMAH